MSCHNVCCLIQEEVDSLVGFEVLSPTDLINVITRLSGWGLTTFTTYFLPPP